MVYAKFLLIHEEVTQVSITFHSWFKVTVEISLQSVASFSSFFWTIFLVCYRKVSLRAFFDYNPLQDPLIPCKEVGIAFSTGDILHVVNMEDAKWWQVSWTGPLRSEDGDGSKNVAQKLNSRSINLNRDYSNSNGFVKCRRTFLELNS